MSMHKAALPPLLLALALGGVGALNAADLRVDQLELLSRGAYNATSGAFEAGSRLYFDLALEGGDKFAGLLKMDFQSGDIEDALALASESATSSNYLDKIDNLLSPHFRVVAVTARSALNLPLDISYFVGRMDNFCSGDDFVSLFGAAPFATELRGPMVYPDGVGGDSSVWYDGIHGASGTGFRLATTPKLSSASVGYLYLYQDSNVGTGSWSGDLRWLFNSEKVKAEAFAGATTGGSYGIYRGGLLFYAQSGSAGEFLAQAGVTHWKAGEGFSLDNLFFLFEPRIALGAAEASVTVFYHPSWYLQKDYGAAGERGAMDADFNLRFGRIAQSGMQGGLETLLAFRPLTTDAVTNPPLAVDTAPYYSIVTGGIRWDFKLDLRLFPFPNPWYGIFRPYIGLKTSF
jgi:hypothetical protein